MTIPSSFWITSGKGESDISELSAIDAAFMDAGIGFQNHVVVSSIPPTLEITPKIDSELGTTRVFIEDEWKMIPSSAIIYVVRSIETGKKGEIVSTCIYLAKVKIVQDSEEINCILAYEAKGRNQTHVEKLALSGLKEMVERRSAVIDKTWGNSGFKSITSSFEIQKEYGCSTSFVVMDPFSFTRL